MFWREYPPGSGSYATIEYGQRNERREEPDRRRSCRNVVGRHLLQQQRDAPQHDGNQREQRPAEISRCSGVRNRYMATSDRPCPPTAAGTLARLSNGTASRMVTAGYSAVSGDDRGGLLVVDRRVVRRCCPRPEITPEPKASKMPRRRLRGGGAISHQPQRDHDRHDPHRRHRLAVSGRHAFRIELLVQQNRPNPPGQRA